MDVASNELPVVDLSGASSRRTSAPPRWWVAGVVWSMWALMTVWQAWFVLTYAGDMGFADEVQLSPWVYGDRPVTLKWLWTPHFEHRIPIPKALYLLVMGVTDDRYRAAALLNVVFLSAAAWVLIRAVGRARGTSLLDVCFPLLLLTLAHWQNLLSGFQIAFTGTVFLACWVFGVLARGDALSTRRGVASLGVGLILLPLMSAVGLLLAGPVAVWWLGASVVAWKRQERAYWRLSAWWSLVVLCLCAAYFVDLSDPFKDNRVYSIARILEGVIGFLTTTLGPRATSDASAIAPVLMLLGALLVPLVAWRAKRVTSTQATGLGIAAVSLIALVLAVGSGRASVSPEWARWPRYTTLTALVPCLLVLACRVGLPVRSQHAVVWPVVVLFLIVTPANTRVALAEGRDRRGNFERIAADAQDGTPTEILTIRYRRLINPAMRTLATFNRMKLRGVGPWRGVPVGTTRAVPDSFDVVPASPVGPTTSPVSFQAPAGRRVWALDMTGSLGSSSMIRFSWTTQLGERSQDIYWFPTMPRQPIWIDGAIDRVDVQCLSADVPFRIDHAEWWLDATGRGGEKP